MVKIIHEIVTVFIYKAKTIIIKLLKTLHFLYSPVKLTQTNQFNYFKHPVNTITVHFPHCINLASKQTNILIKFNLVQPKVNETR